MNLQYKTRLGAVAKGWVHDKTRHMSKGGMDYKTYEDDGKQVETIRDQRWYQTVDTWGRASDLKWEESYTFKIKQEVHETKTQDKTKPPPCVKKVMWFDKSRFTLFQSDGPRMLVLLQGVRQDW